MNSREAKEQLPFTSGAVVAGPEFLPADGIRHMFGVSRSTLYRLCSEGLIRSVNLRRRGFASGRRLFAVDSVRDLIRGEMEKQEKAGKHAGEGRGQ